MDLKFDPKVLRRLAELIVRNLHKFPELTRDFAGEFPVGRVTTTRYDEMGRMTSYTVREDESFVGPLLRIDLDGTVTRRGADGTETVVARFQ